MQVPATKTKLVNVSVACNGTEGSRPRDASCERLGCSSQRVCVYLGQALKNLTHGGRFRVGRSKFPSNSNLDFERLVPRVMGAKFPLGNTSGGHLRNIFKLIIGWVSAVHVAW